MTHPNEPAPTEGERVDAMELVARVLVQIPDLRRHLVRYFGAYSNATEAPGSDEPRTPAAEEVP